MGLFQAFSTRYGRRFFSGRRWPVGRWQRYALVLLVLILAGVAGELGSGRWGSLVLVAPFTVGAGLVLLHEPRYGLLVLPMLATLVPLEVGTGTAVSLNPAVVVIPATAAAWLIPKLPSLGKLRFKSSRLSRPLVAFLLVVLLSLMRGNAGWDSFVPRPDNMTLVQLGQIGIYLLSFVVLWLTANLITDLTWLRRLAYAVVLTGGLAFLILLFLRGTAPQRMLLPRGISLLVPVWSVTLALALALHDRQLKPRQRGLLYFVVADSMVYLLAFQRSLMASWLPALLALCAMLWWHARRLRWLAVLGLVLVVVMLGPASLATGVSEELDLEAEWTSSGGSRLALWTSVIELVSQSPILGLGPAAYRYYHLIKPLAYGGALWFNPIVSAHNQFVDLFGQLGLLGVLCYVWFLIEAMLLATRLYGRSSGFARGYALAMRGSIVGIVIADMFAANFLPFVYNMGFWGFRASALGWMLLGGLAVLENLDLQGQKVE